MRGEDRGEGSVEGEHHRAAMGWIVDWLKVRSLFVGRRKKYLAGGRSPRSGKGVKQLFSNYLGTG